MKNSNMKYKLNSWIVTLIIVAAVVMVNVIVSAFTDKLPIKIDITAAKQYEMSQETLDVMKKLDKEIKVSILSDEESVSPVTKEYINKYKSLNGNFKPEYIDVYKNQSVLYTYQAKGEKLSAGDILLECEGRYKIVASSSIYSQGISLSEDEQNYNFELETKLTNAVVTVSGMMEESAIYFIEGHNEQESSALVTSLDTMGYKNEKISILNADIPSDAKLLISVTPSGDFSQGECEKIDKFLENGGNLLVIFTPGMSKLERLDSYLAEWGIVPNYDLAVEKDESKILQSPVIMLPDVENHEITNTIREQKLPLIFYGSSSFDIIDSNTQRAEVTPIVKSSVQSIGKKNLESSSTDFEEGDLNGPLNLAVVSEKTYPTESRVMVIGSAMALELPEQMTGSKANNEFVSGSVAWLTNNQTNLKIAPKVITEGKITNLTNVTVKIMYYGLVIVLPLAILAVGIVIWLRRRYL